MSNFVLNGDPEFWGSRLVWSATLEPGAFEMAAAGSTVDTIDCWRMTANDPSGNDDATAHLQSQLTRQLPHDVMPGDSYESSADLDLPDGYYHVVLTVDSDNDGSTHQLHVRSENGSLELKSWHTTIA